MKLQEVQAAQTTLHTAMLAAGWALTHSEDECSDEGLRTVREYTGEATLVTDGSGLWGATAGLQVHVKCITVTWDGDDEYVSMHVGISHSFDEQELGLREAGMNCALYTDKGLEAGASALTGLALCFTEYGMQDEFYMSMEGEG